MANPRTLRVILFRLAQVPSLVVILLLIGINLTQLYFSIAAVIQEQRRLIENLKVHSNEDFSEIRDLVDTTSRFMQIDIRDQDRAEILDHLRDKFPFFQTLFYTDSQGTVLVEATDELSLLGLDTSGNEYYRWAITEKEIFVSDPFISLSTGRATVNIAVPVLDSERVTGILVAELDLTFVQNTVKSMKGSSEAQSFILDQAGNVVAHPDPMWIEERRNLGDIPLIQKGLGSSDDSFDIYFDEASQQWMIGSTARMNYNWLVVATQPLFAAIFPVLVTMGISLLAFVISLGVFFWSQYYSVELLTRPIAELVQKTDQIAQGHYEVLPIEEISNIAEIRSLGHSFTQMVEAVQERTGALEESNAYLELQVKERFAAEEEVHKLNAELEQRVSERTAQLTNTNRELESFSYSVSHDLRAPLRAIDGFSRILSEEARDSLSAENARYLQLIQDNSARMNNLLEALLGLSRVTRAPLRKGVIDLSEMAHTIAETLQSADPQRIVDWNIAHAVHASGDATLVHNLLQNLLGNAWKFTAKKERAVIEFGVQMDASNSIYFVRDNGDGFDMKFADRLFGAFQRLHSDQEFEGTGIGLATVQRIVTRHGGKIWAEGEKGLGATFYFTLGE